MSRNNAFHWDTKHTLLARKLSGTHTANHAAIAIGCSVRTLYKYAKINDISFRKLGDKHHRSIYDDHDVELSRGLSDAGVSNYDIGEKLDMPVKYIQQINLYYFR